MAWYKKILSIVKILMDDLETSDFFGVCHQMAFYLLMSFFPMIIFLVKFLGEYIKEFESYLLEYLEIFLPEVSYDYVVTFLANLNLGEGNFFQYLIYTIIFSSLAARAIMVGVSQSANQEETRSTLKIWLYSFLSTFLFAIVVGFLVTQYFFFTDLSAEILEYFNLGNKEQFLQIFTSCFSFLSTFLIFDLIYAIAPAQNRSFFQALPGALFTGMGIHLAFRIFIFLTNHSEKYARLYGNLNGLFALLVSIYTLSLIINLGGKINQYYEMYLNKELKKHFSLNQ